MTASEIAAIISPFVAVLTASGWIHGQFTRLREEVAELRVKVAHLESELQRLRGNR